MNTEGIIELLETSRRNLELSLELAREKKCDPATSPDEQDELDEAIDEASRHYW